MRKEGCRKGQSSSSLSFLFRCSRSFVTSFFLGLVLYSILFPYFQLGGKDEVLFPNAVERNFQSFNLSSAVRSVLQLEFPYWDTNVNQCKVFQTTKQPVFFAQAKNAPIVERMVWSKTNGCVTLLSEAGGRGKVSETGERNEKYL